MNKKGFTLVELMSVITILAILALITIPIVDKALKDGKQKMYDAQIKTIELAAKDWASENAIMLPRNDGEEITLTVLQLKAAGKLDFDLIDPITEKMFSENLEIVITRNVNNYLYSVFDKNVAGDPYVVDRKKYNDDTPVIELNGSNIIYIKQGDEYNDLGCNAKDYNGYPVACTIASSSQTVNIYTRGLYTITYNATNRGITTIVKRSVVVLPL